LICESIVARFEHAWEYKYSRQTVGVVDVCLTQLKSWSVLVMACLLAFHFLVAMGVSFIKRLPILNHEMSDHEYGGEPE